MKTLTYIAFIVSIITLIIVWSNKHDTEVMKSADKYEECVIKEYGGMTPAHYYAIHGEYPECDYKDN